MILVSIFSFMLAAAIYLESLIRKTDFFSPERAYLFFHATALGVAFLALDKAMTPFQPLTSLVYFGSAACFVLGVWTVKLLAHGEEAARGVDFSSYNWKIHFTSSFFLLVVFTAGMLTAYHGIGEFPIFSENKGKAIKAFFAYHFTASVALSYGGMAALLFFIAIFRPRTRSLLLSLSLWITVAILVLYSFALSRSGIIFFCFSALFFFHYAVRRLSMWKLSAFFLAFALLIVVTGYQKAFALEERYGFKTEKVLRIAFKIPYLYFANNYWNLDYALNRDNHRPGHPPTYGFVTASGILDFIYLPGGFMGGSIRSMGGFDDQFHKSSVKVKGLNTISYQWALYKDFGVSGVFVGAFALGSLIGWLYVRMRRYPTMLNVGVYSYLSYFVALSMFGYFPEAPIYVYGLLYVAGTLWLGQKLVKARPAGAIQA